MARLSANLQISRLAVYNTYIPQTGNYEFAAFLEVKSRICKKFAVIGKKICRICRFCHTLRKFFHQFLEFYGGAGDPSTAQKYDFLSVFSTSVLVRLNPYRWGRPILSSTKFAHFFINAKLTFFSFFYHTFLIKKLWLTITHRVFASRA